MAIRPGDKVIVTIEAEVIQTAGGPVHVIYGRNDERIVIDPSQPGVTITAADA